jgi:hypothetical protein
MQKFSFSGIIALFGSTWQACGEEKNVEVGVLQNET